MLTWVYYQFGRAYWTEVGGAKLWLTPQMVNEQLSWVLTDECGFFPSCRFPHSVEYGVGNAQIAAANFIAATLRELLADTMAPTDTPDAEEPPLL